MEKYRKQIVTRMTAYIIAAVLCAVLFGVLIALDLLTDGNMFLSGSMTGTEASDGGDFVAGFRSGFCMAVVGIMVINIIRYANALRNEEKLKKMYICETDERTRLINEKTASGSFTVTSLSLGVATVVSSFFSMTVLFTLIGVIMFITLVKFVFYFYYSRKY